MNPFRARKSLPLDKEKALFDRAGRILAIEDGASVAKRRAIYTRRYRIGLVVFLLVVPALFTMVMLASTRSVDIFVTAMFLTIISIPIGVAYLMATRTQGLNNGPYRFHEGGVSVYWDDRLYFMPWEMAGNFQEWQTKPLGKLIGFGGFGLPDYVVLLESGENSGRIKAILRKKLVKFVK
jgi:hypothetical protein